MSESDVLERPAAASGWRTGGGRAQPWVTLVVRVALAGIFLWAGLSKIGDLHGTLPEIRAYRILPEGLVKPWGYGQPFVEIGLGLFLLLGLLTRWVAIVTGVLLLAFIAAIASLDPRGIKITCGCFSGGGQLPPGQHTHYLLDIGRDAGILALAALLAVFPRSPYSADRFLEV